MSTFRCPQCNHRVKVLLEDASQLVRCPKCDELINTHTATPEGNQQVSAVDHPKTSDDKQEAGLSKPSQEINHEELIDMTAMVDIVFFLLIFFLVTSMSAIQSSALLPRPETRDEEKGAATKQSDNVTPDSDAITVKINKDDSIEIDGVRYREISDLIVRLHQLKNAAGNNTSLLIIGDADASHGTAVSVLDAGYEVGINRLRLAVVGDDRE